MNKPNHTKAGYTDAKPLKTQTTWLEKEHKNEMKTKKPRWFGWFKGLVVVRKGVFAFRNFLCAHD